MQVSVVGSTGGVGALVVARLVATGHEVVAVRRSPGAGPPGVRQFVADVEDGDLTAAFAASDAVLWCAGARLGQDGADGPDRIDRDGTLRGLAAASAAGVRRWVQLSSLMADDPGSGPPLLLRFLQAKQVSDDAVRGSGLDWTVVRPSGLTDAPATGKVRAGSHLQFTGMAPSLPRADLADVLVATLATPATVGAAFDLCAGDTEITAALAGL